MFPDVDLDTVALVVGDERVMLRFEATDTHDCALPIGSDSGEMGSVEATGTHVSWRGFVFVQFDDGEIARLKP